MGYETALKKAWDDIKNAAKDGHLTVKFLSDEYDIDIDKRSLLSRSCNIPAKDHVSIILLHYYARKLRDKNLPGPTGDWVDFRSLEGGDAYFPAFRKRTTDYLIKKFGRDSIALIESANRFPSRGYERADRGVIIYPFEDVPILIIVNMADEEFGADANILFDRSIGKIFCTEDIVVLTDIVAREL